MQLETSKQSTTDGVASSTEMNQVNVHACDMDPENKFGFICRICLEFHGKANDDLISPCMCKGTQGFVHQLCLDRWRSQKEGFGFSHCPTCKSQFHESAQCDFTFKLFVAKEVESIREVLDFCKRYNASEKLQRRMLAHIFHKYKIKLDGVEEEEILDSLDPQLQSPCYQLYSAVEKAYLFKGVSNDLILQLVSKMETERHTGRFIVQNEAPSHLYIVLSGSVNLSMEVGRGSKIVLEVATTGDMIGEVTTICGMPQHLNAQPVDSCVVARLDRGTFVELVQEQERLSDGAIIMNNISQHIKEDISLAHLWFEMDNKNILNCAENDMITLHFAALGGKHYLMHKLLKGDSDPNDSDEKGRTALHIAASKGSEECVRLLLVYGANPNSKDGDGSIPLWEAMLGGHESVIKLLMRYGADISFGDVGTYAHIAAHYKNLNLLEQIVRYGGDIYLPSLIDSKIKAAWVRQKTTRDDGFLDFLFKVVTFDYVRRADDEQFFGSTSLFATDFPHSLLVSKTKRYPNRLLRPLGRRWCQNKRGCQPLPLPRVIMSCPGKNENSFMVLLPDSFEELLQYARNKFMIFSGDIVVTMGNGAHVDCIEVIRDGDSLVIIPDVK